MTEEDPIVASRKRRLERFLKEFHKSGKKGNPTKEEEEKLQREIKQIRRKLWKKYKERLRRMAKEKKTGIVRCAAKGCRKPVDYIWVDAYLPDSKAILIRGEISCYPLCIDHDTMLHGTLDRMNAGPSELMRERVRIRR